MELFEASRSSAQTDTKAAERAKEREFAKLKAEMQAQIVNVQGHILDELDYSAEARLADVDLAFGGARGKGGRAEGGATALGGAVRVGAGGGF